MHSARQRRIDEYHDFDFITNHEHVGVLGRHGALLNGPIAIIEAISAITPMERNIPTVSTPPANTLIRTTAIIAMPVAELIFAIPATAHQKSQIFRGQESLLLLYQSNKIANPIEKNIIALVNAAHPVTRAHAGGIYIIFTKPTAMKIIPQYFNQKSHTHLLHCKMR